VLLAAAILVGALIVVRYDFVIPTPDSRPCQLGFCRFDQMFSHDSRPAAERPLTDVKTALHLDPANPYRWLELGEYAAAHGDSRSAISAFERAVVLGPHLPLVLMRAANYDFANGRTTEGVPLASRVLLLTPRFDEIIFTYLSGTVTSPSALLGAAIPPDRRAVNAFLAWLETRDNSEEILKSWRWIGKHALNSDGSTSNVAWYLWNRKLYQAVLEVTATQPNRVNNPRFKAEPRRLPVDWVITPQPAVEVSRETGLAVEFLGSDNVAWAGVRQMVVVKPGPHTLRVDWAGDGLTTNEGPYVRVFDAGNPARLDVRSEKLNGSVSRRTVRLPFVATPGTQAIAVQFQRDLSHKLDNKIAGRLHIYEVVLE